jgi:single-stranded DNA-binding protein
MNNCIFSGYVYEKPELQMVDGVSYCNFSLLVNEERKGNKIETIIDCEIWDSGAEAFVNLANGGDEVFIESSARNTEFDEEEYVIFRVNKFKIIFGNNK